MESEWYAYDEDALIRRICVCLSFFVSVGEQWHCCLPSRPLPRRYTVKNVYAIDSNKLNYPSNMYICRLYVYRTLYFIN